MSEQQIDLSSGTIRYRDVGHCPTVVFVHGLLVDGSLWRKVVPPLQDQIRCIVPDWPLGSHTIPMKPTADLTPTGVAALIGEFLKALDLTDVKREMARRMHLPIPEQGRCLASVLQGHYN